MILTPEPVLEMFRELEFRSLTNMLVEKVGVMEIRPLTISPSQPPTETIIVRTQAQLDELVKKLNSAKAISFDVETTGLDKMTAELVGICLAVEPPTAYYIPVGHLANTAQANSGQMGLFAGEPTLADGQLPLPNVLDALRPAMTNPGIRQNRPQRQIRLYRSWTGHGLTVTPITFDTMIAEWLTDPATKHKGLKDLSRHRLGMEMTDIQTLIGKGKNQKTFAEVPIEDAAPYGAADADMTLRLVEPLKKEIEEKGLDKLLDLEMPLIPVLSGDGRGRNWR